MLTRARAAIRQPLWAASLLLALILTATGAFGTHSLVLPVRLACWLSITLVAAASLLLARRMRGPERRAGWRRNAIDAALAAIPATLMAIAAGAVFLQRPLAPGRLLALYPAVLVLALSLLALWRLTERRETIVHLPAPVPDDAVPAAIASRLPPRLSRSRLLAVEAQDHYLRVITYDGDALIHMRFADALAALAQSDGSRAHRSWWVARRSIETMDFANGRGELTLVRGQVVPVSRSFAADVKQLARRPGP